MTDLQQSRSFLDRLDDLADAALDTPRSKLEAIVSAFRIIIMLAYLIARKRITDQISELEALKKKQEFEINQGKSTRDELAGEKFSNA